MVLEKEKLEKLYTGGLSMQEIADKVGLKGHSSVAYLMNKFNIRRRSRSEAAYVKRNKGGDSFDIKKPRTSEARKLFNIAMGLYLGEGDKKSKYNVAIANTDPYILRIFIRFLREICNVKERKIAAELNIFNDVDLEKAKDFWIENAGIRKPQLKTLIIRESRGGSYKNKSPYGTLTIYVSNVKLKKIIIDWCNNAISV